MTSDYQHVSKRPRRRLNLVDAEVSSVPVPVISQAKAYQLQPLPRVAQFLDLDAEVDQDDLEESSGDEEIQDFITDQLVDEGNVQEHEGFQVHHSSAQEEHEELVQCAERFQRAYRSSSYMNLAGYRVDPSEDLLRHIAGLVAHLTLWRVSVKPGFESECLAFLRRKVRSENRQGVLWTIGSAFARPSIPGVIYIEAPCPADIHTAFDKFHIVYPNQTIVAVPPEERIQLINMPGVNNLVEGDWVRIKKGLYKGDVGYVVAVTNTVELLLVPRLSYQVEARRAKAPPALFDPDRARAVFGLGAVQQVGDTLLLQGMKFKGGLLQQAFVQSQLITKGVRPTFEEIQLFSESPGWNREARDRWEAEEAAATLRTHDRIKVVDGDLTGLLGIVTNKHDNIVEVDLFPNSQNEGTIRVELSAAQIRKHFKIGDYVRVRCGSYAGKYGYVVKVSSDNTLEFVEWDKSVAAVKNYEPNPRQHFAVCALSVDFGQEQICFANPDDDHDDGRTQLSSEMFHGDPMAGVPVFVVKSPQFRGYYGTIRYTHRALKIFGVTLDANGKIVHLPENFLVDRRSALPIYYFRKRPANIRPLRLPEMQYNQPTPSPPTPMWESPLSPPWAPSPSPSHECDAEESRVHLPPGVDTGWLSTCALRGACVQVRIVGFRGDKGGDRQDIPDGCIAHTTGKPVSGEPPEIEVKLMIAGTRPMSIPSRFLEPVQPYGVKDRAIIIAGEHLGKEVIVKNASGSIWELSPTNGHEDLDNLTTVFLVPADHLVACMTFHTSRK